MLQAFYSGPTMYKPHKRVVIGTVVLVVVALLGALIAFTASANPPAAADVRMQNLVNALREDRLTAARHDAQRQLEEAGEAAVPALLVALKSNNATLRRNAADMLGFIASPQSINGLTNALMNDPILDVRRNAAWSLGEINSFAPYAALQHAALFDTSSLVRNSAQDSLARVRSRVALAAGIDEGQLNAFAISSQNPDLVYATSARNLLISKDGGKSWQVLSNVLPSLTDVLAVSPANSQELYAGVDSLGMYKSTDGGHTWTARNAGLNVAPGVRWVPTAITIDAAQPQRIVVATGVMLGTSNVEFHPTGLYVSINGGATWTMLQDVTRAEPLTQIGIKDSELYALAGNDVLIYHLD